jgi:hypothetical protein
MPSEAIVELSRCTPIRQALEARPPRAAHATVLTLVVLLGTAVAWSALTTAETVVQAPARVRPST